MKYALSLLAIGLACLIALPSWSADDKGSASGSGSGSGSPKASGSGSGSGSASASASGSGSGSPKGSGSASASSSGSSSGSVDRYSKLTDALPCKIQSWEKDSHALVLETMVVDQGVARDIQNLEYQIRELYKEQNPVTRQQKFNDLSGQIVQKQANLYKPSGLKLEVKAQEDLSVRMKDLPTHFDDKGNIVIPTDKEKKAKEDPKHKGLYMAEPGDLHNNMFVQVTLVGKVGSGAKLPDILKVGPKPGADPNQQIKMDVNIQVSYILIVADAK